MTKRRQPDQRLSKGALLFFLLRMASPSPAAIQSDNFVFVVFFRCVAFVFFVRRRETATRYSSTMSKAKERETKFLCYIAHKRRLFVSCVRSYRP